MKIEELPITDHLKQMIIGSGITILYPPQEDALKAGALEGRNLVLATPTASGKTLVAELSALKQILEYNGKVIYLTPLRALASEKFEEFQKYKDLLTIQGKKVKIAISTGDYDSSDSWLGKYDLIIMTNEKCDSLLRHKASWIENITLVIADEIHLLNDGERGPTLEVTITKLMQVNPKIQILALSATVRNVEEVANWLSASYVTTEWRPVKLVEGVYSRGECQFNSGDILQIEALDKNPAISLAVQTIKQGGQSLIFAETRARAVGYAKYAAPHVRKLLDRSDERNLHMIAEKVTKTEEQTRINDLLASLIRNGVAFHHAGLGGTLRKIIEDSFRQGKIKLISATPTLAAGVNLPARRVVIGSYERYDMNYGKYPITVLDYKQMAGRAGRPKYDKVGEAVLIAKTSEEQEFLFQNYVYAKPERIWSKLAVDSVLRSHVLALVATGVTKSERGLYEFFDKTFCTKQYGSALLEPLLKKVLLFLHNENMVSVGKTLQATKFGHRVSEMYIDPASAVVIRDCLQRKSSQLSDLSLLQMVCHTPDISPKVYPRRGEMDGLEVFADSHSSEFLVPIPEQFDDIEYNEFLGEVKAARVIETWIQEIFEDEIIERFSFEPGDLFRLVDSVDWLLYASFELSKLFNHQDLLPRIVKLRERVNKGVKEELLPLVRLRGVGRVRGRTLFNAGFESIEDLKRASIDRLLNVPMIGPRIVKQIKEQVGSHISKEEWKRLKSNKEWKQMTISEF